MEIDFSKRYCYQGYPDDIYYYILYYHNSYDGIV